MRPFRTRDMTDTMVGPEESDVLPLPCLIIDGQTASVWELDEEDKRKLAEGGQIGLVVMAHPTPPVAISVAAPYCQCCDQPMAWRDLLGIYVCSRHDDAEDGHRRSQTGG